jgi:hypothetical protein
MDVMPEPEYPVHDDFGRQIGTVRRAGTSPSGAPLWHARGLDGADLGTFPDRDEAHIAARLDWALGRPRTADTHERYHRAPGIGVPVYLGH